MLRVSVVRAIFNPCVCARTGSSPKAKAETAAPPATVLLRKVLRSIPFNSSEGRRRQLGGGVVGGRGEGYASRVRVSRSYFRPAAKSEDDCSQPHEVQLDLRVAVFVRPHVERGGGDLVDDGDGEAEPRQVNALEVVPAGVTGFHADVVVRGRVKVAEHRGALLPAVDAQDAAERPHVQARRAEQLAPAAARWGLLRRERADLRPAAAERAAAPAPFQTPV